MAAAGGELLPDQAGEGLGQDDGLTAEAQPYLPVIGVDVAKGEAGGAQLALPQREHGSARDLARPQGAAASPVAAELGDLTLRTGRLAYRNPRWTPRSGAVGLRAPEDLAHSAADLREVLAAVHHGLDAIAKIAVEDMGAVRCAATEDRIYLNIPPGWRISRRYKPAPQPQTGALLHLHEPRIS